MTYRFAIDVMLLVCAATGSSEPGSARYEGSVENSSRERSGAGCLTVFPEYPACNSRTSKCASSDA